MYSYDDHEPAERQQNMAVIMGGNPDAGASYRGFTLLEVVVAVAIIAIALGALLKSQAQSVSMAGEARFYTTAALLAQDKMAQLEMEGFDNLLEDAGDFGDDFPGYRWKLTIQKSDFADFENMAENLQQIDLTVSRGDSGTFLYTIRYFYFMPAAAP